MNEDIKEFAKEIGEKLRNKHVDSDIRDMIRQMLIHKMNKENWIKITTEKDSL